MKNKIYYPALFLVLLTVLLLAANGRAVAQESKAEALRRQDGVQITSREEKYNDNNLEVNLKIPVIAGMADTDFQSRLNTLFESSAAERKKAITEQAGEFVEEADRGGFPLRTFQLYSDYRVTCNRNGLLSITCEFYEYTGGAHGMTVRDSYNIDPCTGRQLALKDMFKEGTDYKEIINREIKRQMAADPDKYFTGEEWGFKTISDNQAFYLEDAGTAEDGISPAGNVPGLVVYFDLYEIAPYAAGFPEFKIPWNLFGDAVPAFAPSGPATGTGFSVKLNARPVVFDVSPRLENGYFLVPLRAILEAMGAKVSWYGDTGTAVACLPGATLTVTKGSQYAGINGQGFTMPLAARIEGDRLIVPLEIILQAPGVQPSWDSATQTLSLFLEDIPGYPDLFLDLQRDIQNELERMDRDLFTAAGELARTGLDGEEARRILNELAARYPYVVDACTVDKNGKIVAVEPAAYHEFAGSDISGQEQVGRLWETGRPVISSVFTAVEGFPALDLEWPVFPVSYQQSYHSREDSVFNRQNELNGSVSLLIKPEQFFASFALPELQGQQPEMMVMQKDGYIVYDSDSSQIGRNVFTDPFYQDYTGLPALTRRTVAERAGVGTYTPPEQPIQKQVVKMSVWTTVGLHGTEWRLIINYAVDGASQSGKTAPALEIIPLQALAGNPWKIRVSGLAPGEPVTLVAEQQDGSGIKWESHAVFHAD